MSRDRKPRRVVSGSFSLWLFVALVWGLGCRDRAADETRDMASARPAALPERTLPPAVTPVLRLSGEVDLQNRYFAAVRVSALFPPVEGGAVECSGALVGRRLVLTAGHCVCKQQAVKPREAATAVIDGTRCAAAVRVTAVRYEPSIHGEERAYVNKEFKGRVLPHPELKVLLDEQQRVMTRHADVALILLERSVGDESLPTPWGEEAVEPSTSVILVGYGDDEGDSGFQGQRRSNSSHVVKHEGDQLFLEQPAPGAAMDDGGGPCLRETVGGLLLVGISNRRSGLEPTCTSLYPYRAWLREQLQRTGSEDSASTL